MNTKPFANTKFPPTFSLILLFLFGTALAARADFQSQVLADNPALFFRLSESISAPSYSYATNRGSAGVASQGTYAGPEQTMKQQSGAVAGDAAAAFDGASQYITIPTGAPVNVAPPFTVEGWVKAGTARVSGSFVCPFGSLYRSGSNAKGWLFYQDSDGWNYRQGDSGGYKINIKGGGAPVVGAWCHLAATFDGTTAILYVNGVPVANASNSSYEINDTVPMGIGARGDANFLFPGSVDEVAVYGSVLTPAQIAAHYAAATTNAAGYSGQILASNPVGYWRLDEPVFVFPPAVNSGSLGSAANGGYHANALTVAGAQPPAYPGLGSANSAVSVDGTNGFVRIPELGTLTSSSLSNVTEATFLCWVKRNGPQGNYKGIFAMRPLSSGLYLNSDDTLNYSWNDAANTWGFDSGLIPPDGEWALAAVVIQPDHATFYLQSESGGFSSAMNPVTHSAANLTSGPFAIGNDINFGGNTRYFNGAVDEAALFTKAIGEGRIRSYFLAAAGSNSIAPVLVTDPPVVSPQGTIYATTSFTLSVDAYGSETLTYLWRKDGAPISGATTSSYSKSNVAVSDGGAYDVIVTNNSGSVTSQVANITINPATPPVIDQGPTSQTRYVGGRAAFTVSASGTQPFQYFWRKNGNPILTATASSYAISPLTSGDAASYSVIVSNVAGAVTSAPAVLTLITPAAGSYEETVVNLGPVAYWRLNEANGTFVAHDYMGGYDASENGTVVNGVTGPRPPSFPGLEPGNTASEFDGQDTEVTSGASLVNNRSQFTILGWFRPTGAQIAANGRVGLFGQNDVAEFGFHGLGTIGIWTPYAFASANSSLVQNGQWYFITATADGTNVTLYLNGRQVGQANGPTASYGSSSSPFNIGYAVLDSTGNYFLGDIDEVAFFDRALTAREILNLNSKATGLQFKLTIQGASDIVRDTKPGGTPFNGYNNGAVWVASSTDSASVTRNGVMQFNPTNGPTQVVIPWHPEFNTTEGSMTFWMRSAGNSDTNGDYASMLVDRRTDIGDVIVLVDDGTLFWQPSWIYGQNTVGTVANDNWHHIAYVYDQISDVLLFIDGNFDADHPASTVWSWPANQIELGLSHDSYWRAYDGYLDDFRIYNRKLTTNEVAQIFAGDSSSIVGAADLVGRYNFDQPPGGFRLVLTWPLGTLQSADTVNGPWADVPGATSPYSVLTPAGVKFYRLRL